ncbi:MAG: hypothetical protein ACFCU6_03140 [Balneolaceae bacterium]
MNKLPDLHQQAMIFKNKKRLQHDGGRAWIKDSQLHSARKNADLKFETYHPDMKTGSRNSDSSDKH